MFSLTLCYIQPIFCFFPSLRRCVIYLVGMSRVTSKHVQESFPAQDMASVWVILPTSVNVPVDGRVQTVVKELAPLIYLGSPNPPLQTQHIFTQSLNAAIEEYVTVHQGYVHAYRVLLVLRVGN